VADLDWAKGVAAADLDGDGDLDVAAAWASSDTVAWAENRGGWFGQLRAVDQAIDGPENVAAADLDGDGDVDLVATAFYGDALVWYANAGDGSFGAATKIATVQAARALAVDD